MLQVATKLDCRDGATGVARDFVDGVPAETSAAIVQILKTLAETTGQKSSRAF
jgi:hypothetical protein